MKTHFRITSFSRNFGMIFLALALWMLPQQASAHCDSYDGPVIQDALSALEKADVSPVLKWIHPQHEGEITQLFEKTLKYKNQDLEIYELLEKHFLETLVRLHREGEGAPYTGLKPAGSTSKIIQMTDAALQEENSDSLISALKSHLEKVVGEKYERVMELKSKKDVSAEAGRQYVAAYVDYTHTVEALHDVIAHSTGHNASH